MVPASSLAAVGVTTSEELVKALKANTDPPSGVSVCKSRLACLAWQDDLIRVPRKAELLSEWALETLSRTLKSSVKGKAKASGESMLLDELVWQLLEATLTVLPLPTRNALAAKHNVLLLLGTAIAQPSLTTSSSLLVHLSAAVALLLPAAAARASHSIETITDTIVALLEALQRLLVHVEQESDVQGKVPWTSARACAALLSPLVAGWTAALELGSNSKKASKHFLSNAVPPFLIAHERITSLPSSGPRSSLLRSLEQLSREALFSQEFLVALVASPSGTNELFTALRSAASLGQQAASAVLGALPTLLEQLTCRLAVHRSFLFPISAEAHVSAAAATARQVVQERHAALHGFVAPAFALLETLSVSVAARATSRADLLRAVKTHSLYVPGGDDASAWQNVLKAAGEGALIDVQLPNGQVPRASVEALRVLTTLADGVAAPLLPSALAALAPIAAKTPLGQATGELLLTLVKAAGVQREVPQLLALLVDALDTAASKVLLCGEELSSITILRGPLMAPQLRTQLDTALSFFVAPAQVMELLDLVRFKLNGLLHRTLLDDDDGRDASLRAAKRAKTTRGAKPSTTTNEAGSRFTARLVLRLRVTSVIIESLVMPLPMRSELLVQLRQLHDETVLKLLDEEETQHEAVLAEALRLRGAIVARVTQLEMGASSEQEKEGYASPTTWLDGAIDARLEKLLSKAQKAGVELLLSISATVLERIQSEALPGRQGSGGWEKSLSLQPDSLASRLVHIALDTSIPSLSEQEQATWDGEAHGLCTGTHGAQALWNSIAWEWAAQLDAFAQPDVLHRLVKDVLLPSLAPTPTLPHLTHISKTLACNAAFLELRNWAQPIFSVAAEEATEKKQQLQKLLVVARLPIAYWSAEQRNLLRARAWEVDAFLSKQHLDVELETQWAALRGWLTRLVTRSSSSDKVESAQLVQLVASVHKAERLGTFALTTSTMSLFGTLARHMLHYALRLARSSASGAAEAWTAIVSLEAELAAQVLEHNEGSFVTAAAARVHLIELVLAENKHVPSHVLASLASAIPCEQDVASSSAASVRRHLQSASISALKEASREVRTLCTRLSLGYMASGQSRTIRRVAAETLHTLTSSEVLAAAYNAIRAAHKDSAARGDAADFATQLVRLFAICLRINNAVPAPAPAVAVAQVDGKVQQTVAMEVDGEEPSIDDVEDGKLGSRVAFAFASLFAAFEDRATQEQLLAAYAQCTSVTSATVYDFTLSTVRLAIVADEIISASDRSALLSTAGLLLRNGPEGTLTIAQRHWTRLLSALRVRIAEQAALTLTALQVVEHVCTGKAILLRLADAGLLFALLSDLVGARTSPATSNHGSLGSEIFNAIVTLLASLIRLRPDVVAPLMPHLTVLLAQLLGLLPALRPEAGLAHAKAVQSKLPAWLDVSRHPLSSLDARALARLLSALTTKSSSAGRTPRLDATSTRPAIKSASLARGFSKHAPYVLAAHVRSLVVPTTLLHVRVRAELKTGLFALCDVIGTHERDALMVAHLDAGERALLKEIWNEWEAQRYRGQ